MANKNTKDSTSKKYPGSKFNNKAIENAEKNSVNVNVALDKKGSSTNATEEYLEEMRRKKELVDDIVIIITILVAILLLLSLFNLCGSIGNVFKGIMNAFFGKAMSFVFPFALVFFVFFTRSNKGNPVATRKSIYFWTLICLVCGIINTATGDAEHFEFKFRHMGSSFKALVNNDGGLIGEILSCPLVHFFNKAATILIFCTLILICIILITGKAVIHAIRKKRAEQRAIMRQIREEEREEEERRQAAEAQRAKSASNFNEYRQMSLDEIQEENRRKKLVMVNIDTPNAPEGNGYEFPRTTKKKPGIIERLKGYGKKEPENKKPHNAPDIANYQPIISNTAPVPAYQSEMDRKFSTPVTPAPETDIQNSASYERDASGIPEIHGQNLIPFPGVTEEPEPIGEYIPPEEETYYNQKPAEETAFSDITGQSPNTETASVQKSTAKKVTINPDDAETDIGPVDESTEKPYVFPRIELLKKPDRNQQAMSPLELRDTALKLENTLHSFGVSVTVTNYTSGPNVTRYELQPEIGTKVSRITALADDIKLNLAAEDIRIEAPIPGKSAVGIEVPNTKGSTVYIRSLLESDKFKNSHGKIDFAVGKDIEGNAVVADIAKMPHVLIAGATGSGKSVCINTIIISILYKYSPNDVRMIMIDPKVVELSVYNDIPHLLIPVVTDPKKAYGALNWAVMEMMNRYKWFAELEVRDIEGYNEKIRVSQTPLLDNEGNTRKELPQILIIVDEMADLMMVSPGEVEEAICRLAQLARAAGIHLVLATQRPTVNVITGLIKANVPSRIAFSVASATDSRTILDQVGADKLLGKGDMLFFPSGIPKPVRVQGAFVSDAEVKAVVEEIKKKKGNRVSYNENISAQIDKASQETGKKSAGSFNDASSGESDHDEYFAEAGRFIIEKDKASIGLLQRMYKIGFNRAARIMDQLADAGVVGPEEGTKPRTILMTLEQFENYLEQNGG